MDEKYHFLLSFYNYRFCYKTFTISNSFLFQYYCSKPQSFKVNVPKMIWNERFSQVSVTKTLFKANSKHMATLYLAPNSQK